ncbi:MAG: S8 family serine peptidase [Cyanothece sp. SIO1E1]|nr:S8 family serine peptidase [Cyanothece sp. SIO1E1]
MLENYVFNPNASSAFLGVNPAGFGMSLGDALADPGLAAISRSTLQSAIDFSASFDLEAALDLRSLLSRAEEWFWRQTQEVASGALASDVVTPLTLNQDPLALDQDPLTGIPAEQPLVQSAIEVNDTLTQAIATGLSSENPGTAVFQGTIGDNPTLAAGLDVDFFAFELAAGDRVTLDIDARISGSSLDSGLRLFDANGNQLALSDDNSAPGEGFTFDSYLDFTAATTGTYYVGVSSYPNFNYNPFIAGSGSSGSTGNYALEISISDGFIQNFTSDLTFNNAYGYGLVDAAAAVANVTGNPAFPEQPDLGSFNFGLDLVNAPEVWNQGYTGEGVVVAVVDTGVDYTHADLDGNIWVNPGEIPGNGNDDDGNGFIDDIRGWNFVENNNNPIDLRNHGTHVAGTIAAENNGFGTTGVAYNATIMPVRVLGADGSGSLLDVASGIRYAADNGADVINLSLAGGYSPTVEAAVQYATAQGSVVVMAAGNEGVAQPAYPARFATQQGIAVGAIDSINQLASFSNRAGDAILDYVVAPGVSIASTIPGNSYAYFSGTSMAAPHVAGVAALLLSANPDLTPAEVESLLVGTANPDGITV